MIIERKANTTCDFSDLRIGEPFIFYEDGEIYTCMKTQSVKDEYCNNFYNAVNLDTGEVEKISAYKSVEKINAKIVVE